MTQWSNICRDSNDPCIWDTEKATLVNIQMLNSLDFGRVTGYRAPSTPITRDQYRNIPWFSIYDEHLDIADTGKGQKVFKDLQTLEKSRPREDGNEDKNVIICLPAIVYGRRAPSFAEA